MRLIINLALVALVAVLIYALYDSIREPIAFKDVKETREQIVQEKLTRIRVAQEAYRDITGVFAPSFDTFIYPQIHQPTDTLIRQPIIPVVKKTSIHQSIQSIHPTH